MRFLSIGEAMLELSEQQAPLWAMNVAGDTLNTAWHLKRLAGEAAEVAYFTALGSDSFSARIEGFIADAGIDTRFIRHEASRGPGLYAISLRDGERSFTYWRDHSAAKLLADDEATLAAAFGWADMAYLSGITLAILAPEARERLLAALAVAREAGVTIAFDPNIRPRLWESAEIMRATLLRAAKVADIVLPSFEDEAQHFGDASPEDCARRYDADGSREVVVKNGGRDVAVAMGGRCSHHAMRPIEPVDTTGAGDAFNAGWLFGRIRGGSPEESLAGAHALATHVISHKGALV
ncbi:2-dehydro-3-deoxygluconokinase [Angulomicrobium tetraedrale]|uniref:2-dehydro-3-deoxygluconokinase n=1 Tax=Ancylobacter tetraedralis TaxID=217068 RepID=A0A839ZDI6_9HYPH|nr:2-dehydro-3-deoxygluconokinase [Ancylobacter tetraedralis]